MLAIPSLCIRGHGNTFALRLKKVYMMDLALKLQTDVKNNAEDVRMYMLEMDNWEEQMKQKEINLKNELDKASDLPPPRNRIKRNNSEKQDDKKNFSEKENKSKIKAYDYSAWDKYDADKACAEIDEEENKKLEEENDEEEQEENVKEKENNETKENLIEFELKNIDEAFHENELGNTLVRKEKWEDAIKCYTRAIDLDRTNPTYYANRALCFIKKKNFKSAEVDATVAIQLDKTYIKAFHRRALARSALGQHKEAKSDYEEILKLDHKSAFARKEISKLEKLINSNIKKASPIFDPKCIFKSEPKKECKTSLKKTTTPTSKKIEVKKEENKTDKKPGTSDVKSDKKGTVTEKKVNIIEEPSEISGMVKAETHRVEKLDVKPENSSLTQNVADTSGVFGEVPDGFKIVQPINIPPHLRSKKPMQNIPIKEVFSNSETFDELMNLMDDSSHDENDKSNKLGEEPQVEKVKVTKVTEEEPSDRDNVDFPIPKTFVQFQGTWKLIKKNVKKSYSYLKKVNPIYLSKILKHSLESDLFSELLSILAHDEVLADGELIDSFLCHMPKVDRFGSLVLFMSSSDKENLKKCINALKDRKSMEEIEELYKLYELREMK